jgi:tRNA-specific 2-thiouridylase
VETQNKKIVFVAMSGGVDSSVAALLLKKQGFNVIGVYMKCWSEQDRYGNCSSITDQEDARQTAEFLDIPFYVWDFEDEYRSKVYKNFLDEYALGRTPNPDVMCNKHIKFGLFLDKAISVGADFIATGHYIRSQKAENGSQKLLKAKDLNKDQSYFLWSLNQGQLKHSSFPIGDLTKSEVRGLAKKAGLPTAAKKDSQGICFVGKVKLLDFLEDKVSLKTGAIVDSRGDYLGEHQGLASYTIGQREGLGIGGVGPFYVVDKDLEANTLVVAGSEEEKNFYKKDVFVSDLNWIGKEPQLPLKINVKTRYRQQDVWATIDWQNEVLRVIFEEPQRALTPGQSVVFYLENEMLGGAIINQVS